jgi:hypothetical protein
MPPSGRKSALWAELFRRRGGKYGRLMAAGFPPRGREFGPLWAAMRPIRSEFVLPPPTVVGELGPTGGTLAAKAASGVLAARSVRRRLTLVAARQCGRLVAAACTLRVPPVPAPALLGGCPAPPSRPAADQLCGGYAAHNWAIKPAVLSAAAVRRGRAWAAVTYTLCV